MGHTVVGRWLEEYLLPLPLDDADGSEGSARYRRPAMWPPFRQSNRASRHSGPLRNLGDVIRTREFPDSEMR